MKKENVYRGGFYLAGLLLLALGLTCNTQTGLGVSPIISVSYCIASVWDLNFGDITFLQYSCFVILQMILHAIRDRRLRRQGMRPAYSLKRMLLTDLLQLPLSLVFTRFLNLFDLWIPDFSGSPIPERLLALLAAMVLTGVGAAMSLNMRLIPNPGDGIVQTLADFTGKSVGLAKNCFDALNIAAAILLGLLWTGRLAGVGVGTVCAVIGIGRVVALFNRLYKSKITALAQVKE